MRGFILCLSLLLLQGCVTSQQAAQNQSDVNAIVGTVAVCIEKGALDQAQTVAALAAGERLGVAVTVSWFQRAAADAVDFLRPLAGPALDAALEWWRGRQADEGS